MLLTIGTVVLAPGVAQAAVPTASTPISDTAQVNGPFAAFGQNIVFGTHVSHDGGTTWSADPTLAAVASTGAWRNTTSDGKLVGYTHTGSVYSAVVYSVSTGSAQTFSLTGAPTRLSTSWALSNVAGTVSARDFVGGGQTVTVPTPPAESLSTTPTADLSPAGAVVWSATTTDGHHVVAVATSPTATPSAWVVIDTLLSPVITDTQLTYVVNLTDRMQVCSRSLAAFTSAPTCTSVLQIVPDPSLRLFHFGSTLVVTTPVSDPYLSARRTALWTGSTWVDVQIDKYDSRVDLPYAAGNPTSADGTTGLYGTAPFVLREPNDVPVMTSIAVSGAISRGFDPPRGGAATVWGLDVAADRVVGLDTRVGPHSGTAWTRPVSGSGFGAETLLPDKAQRIATSAGRTVMRTGGYWVVLDRGVQQPTSGYQDFAGLSGPYVIEWTFAGSGTEVLLSTVAGETVASVPTLEATVFGSRVYASANPGGPSGPLQLTVTDVASHESSSSIDLADTNGTCWVRSGWGEVVAVMCNNTARLYNIKTGSQVGSLGSAGTGVMSALVGDGYVILEAISGARSVVTYDGTLLGDMVGCQSLTVVHDGVCHVACATATDVIWRDFSSAATSPGRVLGWLAPRTTIKAWSPEVDVTKPFGAGTLRIRRGATIVRELPVAASADGSLRGVTWDLLDQAGVKASAGSYTAELVVPSADGTGTVKAVDGTSAPTFTVNVIGSGSFVPMTPTRVADTRSGYGLDIAGGIRWNGTIDVQIAGRSGVPSTGVGSVLLNVTVIGEHSYWAPPSSGYMVVFPSGTPPPLASNVNFRMDQVVPNLVLAKLGANGKVTIANRSSIWTQAIVDVAGYFLDGTATDPGSVTGLTPARLLDTRVESGAIPASGTLAVKATGRGGVPASGVSAVIVNLTSVTPKASGYLTAYPSGTQAPNASNVNFTPGDIVATLAFVKLADDGTFTIKNSSPGATQVVADVQGYVLSGDVVGNGMFVPLNPARVLETRPAYGGAGAISADSSRVVPLSGVGGLPASGVGAVVMNVTAIATSSGYLTVYPSDAAAPPLASNVNFVAGQVVPNLAVVKTSAAGAVSVYNGSPGASNAVADIAGYFTA